MIFILKKKFEKMVPNYIKFFLTFRAWKMGKNFFEKN